MTRLAFIMLLFSFSSTSQELVTQVVYEVSYESDTLDQQGSFMSLTMEWNGEVCRQHVAIPGVYEQVTVFNVEKEEGVLLVNSMQGKFVIPLEGDELKEFVITSYKEWDVEPLGASDSLLGYACQGLDVERDPADATFFITKELETEQGYFEDLGGFPLKMKFPLGNAVAVYDAKEVSSEEIFFDVPVRAPKGFKKMTLADYKKKLTFGIN